MRGVFRQLAWRFAIVLWVAAPILGYWPHASPKSGQIGWWVLASLLVLAVGMAQPVRRTQASFGWGCGAVLVVIFSHLQGIGFVLAWAYQVSLVLVAAWVIAERGEFAWLRQAVLGLAWIQVVLVALECVGVRVFPVAGAWPNGSLTTRTGLSILWMLASVWSTRWRAGLFAMLACLTGSWTGGVALARCIWESGRVTISLLVAVPVWLALGHRFWWEKLASRVEVWSQMYWLKSAWIAGWGFLPLPVGFVSTDPMGSIGTGTQVSIYLNNTFLDWIGRTGVVGVGLLVGLFWWAGHRVTAPWRMWTLLCLCWAGMWQSAEVLPVLSLLAVCSVIGFSYSQEAVC